MITKLEIKTRLQILRPVQDVYEAIIDPVKMSNYFISKGSGKLEEGKRIIWQFPEFAMDFPIQVKRLESNSYISYVWNIDKKDLLVEISLLSLTDNETLITITEKDREPDNAGIEWLKGNTEGWANFLACLKAYLEYGINLRKGAFDFLKK